MRMATSGADEQALVDAARQMFEGATVIPGGAAGPAASAPDASVDALERLAAMHQRGELTDEEFAAAKARLLGR